MSETKENLFLTDRGERQIYEQASVTDQLNLPLTRDGFEILIKRCAEVYSPPLPVDDSIRAVVAGYVHHIGNEVATISIEALAKVMLKSIANALTWTIDQEIKQKRQEELNKQKREAELLKEEQRKTEAILKAEVKRTRKTDKYKVVQSNNDEAVQRT